MYNNQYLGILMYIFSIILICTLMLLFGYFLGGRSNSRSKNIPFESGVISTENPKTQYSINFYLIAMVFVIFDVEGIYLYIWSISIKESGWIGFSEILVFIFILLVSLIYLIRIKLFDWKYISLQHDYNKLSYNKNNFISENKILKEDNK